MEGYTGTYDGNPHPITVSGGSGGKIWYSVDNTNWQETMPTRTSAGYGDVYVKIEGDNNHNNKACGYRRITLEKKAVTITANAQTVNYGTAITKAIDKITANGLVSGHNITAITLTQSTTNVTTTGTITPSAATIKSGTTDVTSNYNITYQTGTLTIKAVAPTVTITMSGEKYSDGYKSGAVGRVTCTSSDGISSFTTTPEGTSVSNSQIDVKFITPGTSRSVTGTCTSTSGLKTTKTFTYKIYKYSADSSCGVSSYSYRGTCSCTKGTGTLVADYPSCNSTIYNAGGCYKYCTGRGYGDGAGSCTRSANYKKCYHT